MTTAAADQTNAPQWQTGLLEVRRTSAGPIDVGTKHVFVRNFMGRKLEAGNEYVQYEPNKQVVFRSASGPLTFRSAYLCEPTPDGTRLTTWLEMEAGGWLGLAEPLIAASLGREMEANLGKLKRLLESGSAGVAA